MASTKYIKGQPYVLTAGKHHRTKRVVTMDDEGNVKAVRTKRTRINAGEAFRPTEAEWLQNKDRLAYAPGEAPGFDIDDEDLDDDEDDDPLPFLPRTVAVDELPAALAGIDDPEVVSALQDADTRVTAAGHYERRLNELEGEGA